MTQPRPRRIVAIGSFPPPVTGFSLITREFVNLVEASHHVVVCNIGPPVDVRAASRHLPRLYRVFAACLLLMRESRQRDRACYIGCEGGLGLLYTLGLIGLARLLRFAIYLHHHSFQYIDNEKPLMRAALLVGGDMMHIFLCETMRDRFAATYRTRPRAVVVSNAAFIPPSPVVADRDETELVIGHLSNLAREKGLYLFLDLLRAARAANLPLRGVLAGPASGEDRVAIEAAVQELGSRLQYRGPLYGPEKDRFYAEIDVFVLPTQYVNEAQPAVLFEAEAAGCAIVSTDRGCISAQADGFGVAFARTDDFVTKALEWLASAKPSSGRAERKALYHGRRLAARAAIGELWTRDRAIPFDAKAK